MSYEAYYRRGRKMIRLSESQLRRVIRQALREAEEVKPTEGAAPSDVKIDWGANYTAFISALASSASDPKVQAFIAAGKLDKDENDDKFTFNKTELAVSGLKPTQNEIDVDKSLAWPLKKSKTFIEYVKGAGQTFTLGGPIVTYAGTYVIDGHHRWSQLYACNKDAKISAIDITVEGLEPLDVLKAVQAAIAVQTKSVPTQSVKGLNLMTIDKGGLKSWMDSFNASPAFFADVGADADAMKIMQSVAGTVQTEAADVSEEDYLKAQTLVEDFIWVNVQDMQTNSKPVSGAPKRDLMPQTDNVDWMAPLEAGLIDIVEPHAKTESLRRRVANDRVVLERWQKLAGLIKG